MTIKPPNQIGGANAGERLRRRSEAWRDRSAVARKPWRDRSGLWGHHVFSWSSAQDDSVPAFGGIGSVCQSKFISGKAKRSSSSSTHFASLAAFVPSRRSCGFENSEFYDLAHHDLPPYENQTE